MSGQISLFFNILTNLFKMFMSFEIFNTLFLVSIFCMCVAIIIKLSRGD